MGTMSERLKRYEAEHEFLRQLVIAEEDRPLFTSQQWNGEYRHFRSEKVVCIEKLRRLKNEAA
jgi:hypothetical protein